MYSVLNALSEYAYLSTNILTYQKTLLHTLFCLVLKSSKAFSVSLKSENLLKIMTST